jgi:predicted CopG family antitoxin
MDMCFAIDTDYRKCGLSGIGILTIAEEMHIHGSVENVIENLLKKKREAITKLVEKSQRLEENIEKSKRKIEECERKKNPHTAANLATIEKAQMRIAELEAKKLIQIPENDVAIAKLEAKIEEIEEYLPWYYDIRPKVLQKHLDGTYKIQWQSLTSADFQMTDVFDFLQKNCVTYMNHSQATQPGSQVTL